MARKYLKEKEKGRKRKKKEKKKRKLKCERKTYCKRKASAYMTGNRGNGKEQAERKRCNRQRRHCNYQ